MRTFIVNTLASLAITAIVVVPMAISGAPFWACWGIGYTVWLINKTMDWVKAK